MLDGIFLTYKKRDKTQVKNTTAMLTGHFYMICQHFATGINVMQDQHFVFIYQTVQYINH